MMENDKLTSGKEIQSAWNGSEHQLNFGSEAKAWLPRIHWEVGRGDQKFGDGALCDQSRVGYSHLHHSARHKLNKIKEYYVYWTNYRGVSLNNILFTFIAR